MERRPSDLLQLVAHPLHGDVEAQELAQVDGRGDGGRAPVPLAGWSPPAPASWRQYAAELIGTFALVFIGTGAVTVNWAFEGVVGVTGIALAHGLVLMSMIYALGSISGTHVNPAVSISLWVGGQVSSRLAIGFVLTFDILMGGAVTGASMNPARTFARPWPRSTSPTIGCTGWDRSPVGIAVGVAKALFD